MRQARFLASTALDVFVGRSPGAERAGKSSAPATTRPAIYCNCMVLLATRTTAEEADVPWAIHQGRKSAAAAKRLKR